MEQQNGDTTAAVGQSTHVVGRLTVRPITPANGGQPREYALDGRPIYIGRSPSCDIVLDGDQLTSRRHALLRYDASRYVLVDLGSSNGTYINDTEVREATPLQDGDRVVVGEHELLYSTSAASPEASLPGVGQSSVPRQPPAETNPSLGVVSSLAAEESSVPFPVAVVEYEQSNGADAEGEVESTTEEYPAVRADAWPSDESVSPEAEPEEIDEPAMEEATLEEVATEEPAFADAPAAQDATNIQDALVADTAVPAEDVDLAAMHTQLAQLTAASETLARRMEEQGRQGERRRAAVQEAREQVEALLAQLNQASGTDGEEPTPRDLDALIDVTRQAAENPQHLQYLTRLAEHAGEIAEALQQEQQRPAPAATPEGIRQALEALRKQLESLG
jgi:pSer/pThr/pTyr-binding forkhead associated (FHA) protein